MGLTAMARSNLVHAKQQEGLTKGFYHEPSKKLPVRHFNVVVVGAGTAGVVATTTAAKQWVNVSLIETIGYPGGTVTEGGIALHNFYNLESFSRN